jgi:hypothetical protein
VVGRLTDNVGIAYGATIENGVGGSRLGSADRQRPPTP